MNFLTEWAAAIWHLKNAEKCLLDCYIKTGLKQYDKAHKMLVRRRKKLNDIEDIREIYIGEK